MCSIEASNELFRLETKSTLKPTIFSKSSAKSMNLIPILSENSTRISRALVSFYSFLEKEPKIAIELMG
jgi:hypothetical protein